MTLRSKALQCAINELRYEHDRAKALAIYNKWEVFHEDTKFKEVIKLKRDEFDTKK